MKSILLTGGSGFIGKNIVESFLSDKYKILTPSHKKLDLLSEESLNLFLKENTVDFIIHSAAKPGHRNADDPTSIYYSNTRMFLNLERHSSEFEKMLIIGSGAIYDMRYYSPKMKETDFQFHLPADEHGMSKYICEKIIDKSENIYDLIVFGIFGKYEDYAIRFISNMICKALFDLPLTMKQNRRFDYLFVDDLIPIIDHFLTNDMNFHSYNITPDTSVELLNLAEMVLDISGKDLPISLLSDKIGLEYSGCNKRLRSEFPDIQFTEIKSAIKNLYDWYLQNIDRIDKRLLLYDK